MKLSELPQRYKILAEIRIEQFKKPYINAGGLPHTDSVNNFTWKKSPEGFPFWAHINAAKHAEDLPPIPKKSLTSAFLLHIKHPV